MLSKKLYPILILICLFNAVNLVAQNHLSISAKVIDAQSKEALEFVHVGMPEQGIGTVTNELGEFSFHFPKSFQNDFIIISHIGYQEKWLKWSDLRGENKTIALMPDPKVLDQVEVLALEQPLEFYVEKAISNLKKNYPKKLHSISAFYRELKINADNRKFTRLVEAAVDIQDKGIHTPISELRVQVKELRKSYDYTCYTEEYLDLKERFNKRNALFDLFQWNGVRIHLTGTEATKRVAGLNGYHYKPVDLELKKITYLNDEMIYVIGFQSPVIQCKMYISAEDYGIHRFEHSIEHRPISGGWKNEEQKNRNRINGNGVINYTIQYQKRNGRYYPSAIKMIDWDGRINASKASSEQETASNFAITTLIVNDLYLNRKDFKRIRYRHQAKEEEELFLLELPYHPHFWQNYNILLMEPLEQQTIVDLEEMLPLEEQFIQNGSR